MKKITQAFLVMYLVIVSCPLADESPKAASEFPEGFVWESPTPHDCPFPQSKDLTGVFLPDGIVIINAATHFILHGQVTGTFIRPGQMEQRMASIVIHGRAGMQAPVTL